MTPKSHGRNGRPWRELRLQILARDPFCMIRGPRCKGRSTTVDHIIPLSLRPDLAHEPSNLRGACAPCNYAGGARITNAKRNGKTKPPQPRASRDWERRNWYRPPAPRDYVDPGPSTRVTSDTPSDDVAEPDEPLWAS